MRSFHAIMNHIYTLPLVLRVYTMTHSLSFPCLKIALIKIGIILKPTTNFDRQKRLQSISNGSHKSYPNPKPSDSLHVSLSHTRYQKCWRRTRHPHSKTHSSSFALTLYSLAPFRHFQPQDLSSSERWLQWPE